MSIKRTILTDNELEYRKTVIDDSKSIFCPITYEMLSSKNGEVIYFKGKDYFVSTKGLNQLVDLFGEKFVSERIISYD